MGMGASKKVQGGAHEPSWDFDILLSIYLSSLVTAVAVFRNPNTIPFCFSHWSSSKCLVFMAARTTSIHVFLGRPILTYLPSVYLVFI